MNEPPITEPPIGFSLADESFHDGAPVEEWTFEWWSPTIAGVAVHRLVDRSRAWYGWALWRKESSLVHVIETGIRRRRDPMIAKAEAFWAEFTCEHAFEQWTVGNECHGVELDDPDESLRGARGRLVPIASDLEWYASEPATAIPGGYEQRGVLLGDVETINGVVTVPEIASRRTHRWGDELEAAFPTAGRAHLGPRIGFAFDDRVVLDLVLQPTGWALRSISR